jgi:hypothetical protein
VKPNRGCQSPAKRMVSRTAILSTPSRLRSTGIRYLLDGRPQTSPIYPIDLKYTTPERDGALKNGIIFSHNPTLGNNMKAVRFIVYDRGSNALGSVTIPINDGSK